MKSYDFNAVVYDGMIFCNECLPDGIDLNSDDVCPIFADSEWDYAPVCENCGREHDYMTLLMVKTCDNCHERIDLNSDTYTQYNDEYYCADCTALNEPYKDCINVDDGQFGPFWAKHVYLVSFDNHTGWDSAIRVAADYESEAIDIAADYAESQGRLGYFLDPDDPRTQELESFGEVSYVGNHGLLVNDGELNIKIVV